MTDLPRPAFTPLPPPPGGSAEARRRGRRRRQRQTAAGAAVALAVTGAVLSAAAMSTTTNAVDRLEPAPFATAADVAPTAEPRPTGTRRAGTPSSAPTSRAAGTVAAPQEPAAPAPPQPSSEPAPSAQPPGTQELATDPPLLTRRYDPPQNQDTTVCGGRITGGIGTAQAQTGWCVMAAVQQRTDGRADLAVRVCRSSEGRRADLHVEPGAVTMRLEQSGSVVWRLPEPGTPAEVLPVDPAGCWIWTHTWDGRGSDGEPLPDGATTLHVTSRATEVRDLEDEEPFTHAS